MKTTAERAFIDDIARQAGVSTATVSRVFNHRPYVSEEKRRRILEVARRAGYAPQVTTRTDSVAIVVEDGAEFLNIDTFESYLMAMMTTFSRGRSFRFEIVTISDTDRLLEQFVRVAVSLVYLPESLKKLAGLRGLRIIGLGQPQRDFPSVYTQHAQAMEQAVAYLHDRGHRRIGLYRGNEYSWGNAQRLEGYRQALELRGLSFDPGCISDRSRFEVTEALSSIMRSGVSALIACGEDEALRVNHALYVLGKKVPEDISLITFEHPTVSPYLIPPNTTISQNLKLLAARAVALAESYLQDDTASHDHVFPTELIERASVRAL